MLLDEIRRSGLRPALQGIRAAFADVFREPVRELIRETRPVISEMRSALSEFADEAGQMRREAAGAVSPLVSAMSSARQSLRQSLRHSLSEFIEEARQMRSEAVEAVSPLMNALGVARQSLSAFRSDIGSFERLTRRPRVQPLSQDEMKQLARTFEEKVAIAPNSRQTTAATSPYPQTLSVGVGNVSGQQVIDNWRMNFGDTVSRAQDFAQ